MTAIQWITKEAKAIRKKYPKRFATWREYVAQASAIYAKKHKGKSPVGKKHPKKAAVKKAAKKVGAVKTTSRTHTDKNKITANIQIGNIKKGSTYIHWQGYLIEKKPYYEGKKKKYLFVISEMDKAVNTLAAAKSYIKHVAK